MEPRFTTSSRSFTVGAIQMLVGVFFCSRDLVKLAKLVFLWYYLSFLSCFIMSLSLYPYLSDIMLILPHIILNTKPRLFFPQNICLHQDFYFLANFIEDSVEHKKESDQELDFYFLFFGQTSIIFLLHLFLLFSLSLS